MMKASIRGIKIVDSVSWDAIYNYTPTEYENDNSIFGVYELRANLIPSASQMKQRSNNAIRVVDNYVTIGCHQIGNVASIKLSDILSRFETKHDEHFIQLLNKITGQNFKIEDIDIFIV